MSYPTLRTVQRKSSEFRKVASYAGGQIKRLADEVDRGSVTVKTLRDAKAQVAKLVEFMDTIGPAG